MPYRAVLARQQALNQQHHQRVATRIHDEVSQKMTLLALQLSMATSRGEPPPAWEKNCRDWAALVMQIGDTIREITAELQPRIADEAGLVAAFQWFAQISAKAIQCTISEPDSEIRVAPPAANELFTLTRDVILDILVPAKISRVELKLDQDDDRMHLHLRANDPGNALTEQALDAIAMHERLLCLDGTVELKHPAADRPLLTLSVPTSRNALAHSATSD